MVVPQPKTQSKTWDRSHFITLNTSLWAIYTCAYKTSALYMNTNLQNTELLKRAIHFLKTEKRVTNSLVQLHVFADCYWFINAPICPHWKKGWRCSLHRCPHFEHCFEAEGSARNGVGLAGWPGADKGLGHLGEGTFQPYFGSVLWKKLTNLQEIR